MWGTTVFVRTNDIELVAECFTWLSQQIFHGRLVSIKAIWALIFVKDDVVWACFVVGPCDSVALANCDIGWLKNQLPRICTHFYIRSCGYKSRSTDHGGCCCRSTAQGIPPRAEISSSLVQS